MKKYLFDFESEESRTMYENKVSSIVDDVDLSVKAVYVGADDLMPIYNNGIEVNNNYIEYKLKNPIHIKNDFYVNFQFSNVTFNNSFRALVLNENSFIDISPSHVVLNLNNSEFKLNYEPFSYEEYKELSISFGRNGTSFFIWIKFEEENIGDFSFNVHEIEPSEFSITSLFGGMVALKGILKNIEINLGEENVSSKFGSHFMENEKNKLYLNLNDEHPAKVVVVQENETKKHTRIDMQYNSEINENERKILLDYDSLFKFIANTEFGRRLDFEEAQSSAERKKDYLTRLIFYAIESLDEYENAEHGFLYRRAKFLTPYFGVDFGVEDFDSKLEYGFKEGASYNSFLFGKISNENLTNRMLVKLLLEEYELWIDKIVKL